MKGKFRVGGGGIRKMVRIYKSTFLKRGRPVYKSPPDETRFDYREVPYLEGSPWLELLELFTSFCRFS